MDHKLPKLTPPEFKIMKAVWDRKNLTVTEIMKAVNSESPKKTTRSTIQVQIRRLEEKGWLEHGIEGNTFFHFATVLRENASMAIVQDVNERIFGGSCAELVKSLLGGSQKISSTELKKIRTLIDEYEDEG